MIVILNIIFFLIILISSPIAIIYVIVKVGYLVGEYTMNAIMEKIR